MSPRKWLRRRKAKQITKKVLRRIQEGGRDKPITVTSTAPRWYFPEDTRANRPERLRKMAGIIGGLLRKATGDLYSISVQELDGSKVSVTTEPFTSKQYATYKIDTPLTHP